MNFLTTKRPKGKVYFSKSEFESRGFPKKPTTLESYLLANLMYYILNPIRIKIGMPIMLTDCYRSMAKYRDLKKRGYYPSPTSDHFWAQVIPTTRSRDVKKFGPQYHFSAGAVDFVCPRAGSLVGTFNVIRDLVNKNIIDVGQCILETKYEIKNGKKKMLKQWIHISNPKSLIYTGGFIKDMGIQKTKFLTSDDNGKTYKVVL